VFYDFDVIAQTNSQDQNGDTLTGLSNSPSINDSGKVAFIGNYSDGQGILVGDGTSLTNINPAFSHTPSRTYGPFAEINNSDQVIAVDRVSGSPPLSRLRTWDASTTSSSFQILASAGQTGSPIFDPWDAILSAPALNNNGDVVFPALLNTTVSYNYQASGAAKNTVKQLASLPSPQALHPMVADNGESVVRAGNQPTSDIVLYDTSGQKTTIASGAVFFNGLGSSPGISDDGSIVVFAGDRGNGPGVFASIDDGTGARKLVTIAGEDQGSSGPHSELGYYSNGNHIYFSNIDINNRIAVIHQQSSTSVAAGDSFIVSFMGTPDAPSVTNPQTGGPLLFSQNDGLWTERVDVDPQLSAPSAPLVFDKTSPIPVVQVNDKINGATVNSISVYDPLSRALDDQAGNPRTPMRGDHMIAFSVSTSSGSMIVRGSHLNTSGDGILDHWKTKGVDIDQDGIPDLNLAAMGANIHQRDLFLEVDWTAPRTSGSPQPWSDAIAPGAIQPLVNMFAAAPAEPNGIPAGITLHLDAGPGNSVNMGSVALQGGDQVGQPGAPNTHIDVVYFGKSNSVNVPGLQARAFQDIKANDFGTADAWARELVFHYAVLADSPGFVDGSGAFSYSSPTILSVGSAGPSMLTVPGSPFTPPAAGGSPPLAGHLVKITSGTGAGQIRAIQSNTSNQLTVYPNWTTVPDNTSVFTLLSGNSGLGELDYKPSPDFNSIPGNDLIISLAGNALFNGLAPGGLLANGYLQERTLAHELGHNLGLRHNGNSDNPNNSPTYHSLMSYFYQLQGPPSSVNSYSGAGDPTFDDWANIRMDFQNYDIHLGNTLALGASGTPPPSQPEPTAFDYQFYNTSPPDLTAPTSSFTAPAAGTAITPGGGLTVILTATDDVQVGSVVVDFDVNGNGQIDSGEEVVATSTGPNTYQAVFQNITGPAGSRTIRATAVDTSYNEKTASEAVQVTSSAAANVQVGSSSTSPVYGQSLSFTANVTPGTSGGPTPTGTVQFEVDGVDLGQAVMLVNGAATSPSIANLSAGMHTIAAVYSGDPNSAVGVHVSKRFRNGAKRLHFFQ
jgi:hypothetical protein